MCAPDETDDDRLAMLDASVRRRAVDFLRSFIPDDERQRVRDMHAAHGDRWVAYMEVLELPSGARIPRGHFGWGMQIRNALRTGAGLLDDVLPPGRVWCDFYIPLVEIACDLRPDVDAPGAHAAAAA